MRFSANFQLMLVSRSMWKRWKSVTVSIDGAKGGKGRTVYLGKRMLILTDFAIQWRSLICVRVGICSPTVAVGVWQPWFATMPVLSR